MKNRHFVIITLLLAFLSCTQNNSKSKVYKSNNSYDSVEIDNKFYLYKTTFKVAISKTENTADVVLPQFNTKSDSITLHKVLSKIGSIHMLRYIKVAQDSATFKMYYSNRLPTPEQSKFFAGKFIGSFDLLTHKRNFSR